MSLVCVDENDDQYTTSYYRDVIEDFENRRHYYG